MANPSAPFVCLRCLRTSSNPAIPPAIRTISSTTTRRRRGPSTTDESESSEELPRWLQTPPRMRMPERLRPIPKQPVWKVNDKQGPVDEMYDRFMGRVGETVTGQVMDSTRGRDLLTDEVKWLALTHKSFDHGRRGFNDRLAYLGKRIVDLQTSLALLNMPPAPSSLSPGEREDIYEHPALDGLENITQFSKNAILEKSRLAGLATAYGINQVVRWKPRKSDNLKSSGEDVVLAHTVYSIIGAIALQRGGELATRTVRERILRPLGLR